MNVHFTELRQGDFNLKIDSSETISDVKLKIANHFHIQNEGIKIFWKTEKLSDSTQISTLSLSPTSKLNVYIPPKDPSVKFSSSIIERYETLNKQMTYEQPKKVNDNYWFYITPDIKITMDEANRFNAKYPMNQNVFKSLKDLGFSDNSIYFVYWCVKTTPFPLESYVEHCIDLLSNLETAFHIYYPILKAFMGSMGSKLPERNPFHSVLSRERYIQENNNWSQTLAQWAKNPNLTNQFRTTYPTSKIASISDQQFREFVQLINFFPNLGYAIVTYYNEFLDIQKTKDLLNQGVQMHIFDV